MGEHQLNAAQQAIIEKALALSREGGEQCIGCQTMYAPRVCHVLAMLIENNAAGMWDPTTERMIKSCARPVAQELALLFLAAGDQI